MVSCASCRLERLRVCHRNRAETGGDGALLTAGVYEHKLDNFTYEGSFQAGFVNKVVKFTREGSGPVREEPGVGTLSAAACVVVSRGTATSDIRSYVACPLHMRPDVCSRSRPTCKLLVSPVKVQCSDIFVRRGRCGFTGLTCKVDTDVRKGKARGDELQAKRVAGRRRGGIVTRGKANRERARAASKRGQCANRPAAVERARRDAVRGDAAGRAVGSPTDAKVRRARTDCLEGRRAAAEALRTGFPVKRALVDESQGRDAALAQLVDDLRAADIAVAYVPRAQLDALSSHGAHQGIVLEVGAFPYVDLADVIAAAGVGPALVVVLDHVTDAGNFGAIVRSAEVVGAAGVVIANKRAAEVTVATYKTSAGAVMHLPIARVPNIARALEQLKAAGFWTVGASEHAEGSCWDAPLTGRIALVMGSEGDGISRLVLETCDDLTKLPQRGATESLNVAQAATALCYEWLRVNIAALEGSSVVLADAAAPSACGAADLSNSGKNVPKTAHSEADFGTFLPEFRGVSATVGAASSAAPATDGVGGARE